MHRDPALSDSLFDMERITTEVKYPRGLPRSQKASIKRVVWQSRVPALLAAALALLSVIVVFAFYTLLLRNGSVGDLVRVTGSSKGELESGYSDTGQWGDSYGPLTSLFTGVAVAGALIAVLMEQRARRREALNRLLDIYREWDSPTMRELRNVAWVARHRWYTEPTYRKFQTELMVLPDAIEAQWRRDFPDIYATAVDDRGAVWSLIEFYWMVAQLPASLAPRMAQWAFYYPWWRGFLYDWFETREQKYWSVMREFEVKEPAEECPRCLAVRQLPREPWLETLAALDKLFGLPPFRAEDHPLDRIGTNGPHEVPKRSAVLDPELAELSARLTREPQAGFGRAGSLASVLGLVGSMKDNSEAGSRLCCFVEFPPSTQFPPK